MGRKSSDSRGQGGLEYLLLIGGTVLVASVVIVLVTSSAGGGKNAAQQGMNNYNSKASGLESLLDNATTGPTTTSNYINGWRNTNQAITLTCAPGSGGNCVRTQYRINLGAWQTGTNFTVSTIGSTSVDYNSTDANGNIEGTRTITVQIEITPPVTTDNHVNGWTTGRSIALSCTDSTSNCASTKYKVDNNSAGWMTGTNVVFNSDGNHRVDYNSTDNAGNIEAMKTVWVALNNGTGTAPTTTNNYAAGWHNASQTITLTCTPGSGGACQTTQYRIDAGAWQTGTSFTVSAAGNHTADYNSRDVSGNVETTKTISVQIDLLAPVTTDNHANGWSAITGIALSCADPASGCLRTQYRIDQNANGWINGTAIVLNGDGNHRVDYNSIDNAGNIEVTKTIWAAVNTGSGSLRTMDDHASGTLVDANIHLTCTPSAICYATYYRIDAADSLLAPYPDVWIANYSSNTVSRINPMTNTVIATVTGISGPIGIAVDQNQNVWVGNYISSGRVSRINAQTNSVIASIPVGAYPWGIAVDASQNVWVVNMSSNTVSRINPQTNSVANTISGFSSPYGIAVDKSQKVWVADYGGNRVSRINPQTNSIETNITSGLSYPINVSVDQGQNVWASNYGSNRVSKIDPATNSVITNVTVGSSPWGSAIDANQNVWVANVSSRTVSRINPKTNSVVATITVGNTPIGIAIDANQNVWVSNASSSYVSRINPKTNSVIANVTVGSTSYSPGDFTGFALQNFVLSNGWKMYGGNNDQNIYINASGSHRIDYYSIDKNRNTESMNTVWVTIG